MSLQIEAIFENGVFRPQSPVDIVDGQHVVLHVDPITNVPDDISDVADLLDLEFMESCRQRLSATPPTIEEVNRLLSSFKGSLADWISAERDER